jgi:trans-aconitate 2-methyltransferase
MTDWNPEQYLKFKEKRTLPAIDLADRIEVDAPSRVIDLGCGTGTSTAILKRKWPHAKIFGLDSSVEMLAKAESEFPEIAWIKSDLNDWRPLERYDVIFSNAALQWIKQVDRLVEAAFGGLESGGAFAFQVPNNENAPYQQCIMRLVEHEKWTDHFTDLITPLRFNSMEFYYELLAKRSSRMDIWETRYYQIMDGPESILEWVSGTFLRPYLKALVTELEKKVFKTELLELYRKSYTRTSDGKVIFPFNRQFVIAYK